jgi:hypothetical protein
VQLLVDALEHVVVQVPGLVQLSLLAGHLELLDPLVRLTQLTTIRLLGGVVSGGSGSHRKVRIGDSIGLANWRIARGAPLRV